MQKRWWENIKIAMTKISNYIEDKYSSLPANEKRHEISPMAVNTAINVVKFHYVKNEKDLFYYLAAINLLNAAIKMKKYKKSLSYRFIKGKARVITECVIARKQFKGVNFYYSAGENCLYVKVLDVIFSFHYVDETPFILNIASAMPPIKWSGIKLQIIAEDVFIKATELVS